MTAKEKNMYPTSTWIDPDEIPEITDEDFARAKRYVNGVEVKRPGRPALEHPKVQVSIRLDADLVQELRSQGPGWQTRANEALRKAVGL